MPSNPPDPQDTDFARIWRARAVVTGRGAMRLPGELWAVGAQVSTLVTEFAGPLATGAGDRIVHLILRSRADTGRVDVLQALAAVGREAIVVRGEPGDLDDIATRVLKLATRLAADPDAAPRGAAALVFADSWEVAPAVEGDDASPYVMRLQWMLDRHVVLRREQAAFTGFDKQRAAALLELVAALAQVRGEVDEYGWNDTVSSGDDIVIRLARPRDARDIELMHERCSERSRFHRYFAPMSTWREENLRRISGEHRGATLVAVAEDSDIVGLGNVFPVGPDETQVAEIALIVDDAWQGRGVGTLLLRHLIDAARRLGFTRLVAYVHADNPSMVRLLLASTLSWEPMEVPDMGPSVRGYQAEVE